MVPTDSETRRDRGLVVAPNTPVVVAKIDPAFSELRQGQTDTRGAPVRMPFDNPLVGRRYENTIVRRPVRLPGDASRRLTMPTLQISPHAGTILLQSG